MEIKESKFKVIVKPNSKKNEILGYDENKKSYRVAIKERAEKGKANLELVKFLNKLLKKRVKIIKGLRSKEKLIQITES